MDTDTMRFLGRLRIWPDMLGGFQGCQKEVPPVANENATGFPVAFIRSVVTGNQRALLGIFSSDIECCLPGGPIWWVSADCRPQELARRPNTVKPRAAEAILMYLFIVLLFLWLLFPDVFSPHTKRGQVRPITKTYWLHLMAAPHFSGNEGQILRFAQFSDILASLGVIPACFLKALLNCESDWKPTFLKLD
jgi:hypothetical protein